VPLEPVVIQDAEVFVDPIQEAAEELIKEREELAGKVEPKISGKILLCILINKFSSPT
jgi:hypothetical protein